jgi:hypothetical protein
MDERIEMRGGVILQLVDRHGRVVYQQQQGNRIVRSGRRLVAELFGGVAGGTLPSRVSHMAVGTDGTAANDDQIGLLAQRGGRKPITEVAYTDFEEPAPGGGVVRRVRASVTSVFDFDEANDTTTPLREAGIFNAASGGVMYNRVVFEPVTKTNSFRLTLLWDIVF